MRCTSKARSTCRQGCVNTQQHHVAKFWRLFELNSGGSTSDCGRQAHLCGQICPAQTLSCTSRRILLSWSVALAPARAWGEKWHAAHHVGAFDVRRAWGDDVRKGEQSGQKRDNVQTRDGSDVGGGSCGGTQQGSSASHGGEGMRAVQCKGCRS